MSEVFEKPLKAKKPRKPMSAEAKAKLVERLAAGRQRKKMKKLKDQEELKEFKKEEKKEEKLEIKIEPKQEKKEEPIKISEVPRVSVREKSAEIQKLRDELELQELRNQLDDLKMKNKPKKVKKLPTVVEEPAPKPIVNQPPVHIPSKPIPIPLTKRQKILKQQSRYANFY